MGGIVSPSSSNEVSDIELSFLRRVIAWEKGSMSTHGEWLARHGWMFPAPENREGAELKRELWRLIEALAMARVFLSHTNHLSDGELYSKLFHEVLPARAPDFARTTADACHWDFAEAGGSDDPLWLTYYASEEDRQDWKTAVPAVILPPRQVAPHPRDHQLPAAQ
jgi:hypothetical protein